MRDRAGVAIDDHEARGIAGDRRFLRNTFLREVVIEEGGVHE
jgi:hypothetical protein